MNVQMKNGYILLKSITIKHEEKKTESGILLPISNKMDDRFAEIVAVAENSKFHVGQIVAKPIGRGTLIEIDGTVYESVEEDYIYCIINDLNI